VVAHRVYLFNFTSIGVWTFKLLFVVM